MRRKQQIWMISTLTAFACGKHDRHKISPPNPSSAMEETTTQEPQTVDAHATASAAFHTAARFLTADNSDSTHPIPGISPGELTQPNAYLPRRLTRPQYLSAMEVLFNVDLSAERAALPLETQVEGFIGNVAALTVSAKHIEGYDQLAEKAVRKIPQFDKVIRQYTSCQNLAQASCMHTFIERLGAVVWRGSLSTAEVQHFEPIIRTAREQKLSFTATAQHVLMAMLQSPRFLYLLENEQPAGGSSDYRISTQAETLSRMTLFVLDTVPSPRDMQIAQGLDLRQAQGRLQLLDHLLKSDRKQHASARFVLDWSGVSTFAEQNMPGMSKNETAVLMSSLVRSYQDIAWKNKSSLMELFTLDEFYISQNISRFFDLPTARAQQNLQQQRPGEAERRGILTHPAFLAAMSDNDAGAIVIRGLNLLDRVFCGTIGSPPAELMIDEFTHHLDKKATERDYSEERLSKAQCAGCHMQFDTLAHAFERFNRQGIYHRHNAFQSPLRADGKFTNLFGSFEFSDNRGYATQIQRNVAVQKCLVQKHLEFALGHSLHPRQQGFVTRIHAQLTQGQKTMSYVNLLREIVRDDFFIISQRPTGDLP
ncbi:MAG: DUF1588 domain-containing protein [Zetaproteobacteria bacterium]|nr:DUF1588 domain-containing protein [Zetaproteobacteria bacterium]